MSMEVHTVRQDLLRYLETYILPQYAAFTDGHDRSHVDMVLRESLCLARAHCADEEMASVIAAYHDLGIPQGRKEHHLNSAKLLLQDAELPKWFTEAQLALMAQAVEDHRASADRPPRTLYGCIIADADHFVVPEDIIKRTVLYGLQNYPAFSKEEHIVRARAHMEEKFCRGGYLKFWLNDPRSLEGLENLRTLVADEPLFRAECLKWL